MSERGARSVESYVRRIAETWERLSGRAVILSEREWRLLCDWHARGVPLAVVEEALRAACERRAGPPRSLAWLAPAVEHDWAALRDGRTTGDASSVPEPLAAWRRRRDAAAGSPLGDLLDALLAGLGDGSLAPEAADERLDAALHAAAPAETARRAGEEVDGRLAGFRGRLDASTLARTRERAVTEALRTRLGLPRMAGTGTAVGRDRDPADRE